MAGVNIFKQYGINSGVYSAERGLLLALKKLLRALLAHWFGSVSDKQKRRGARDKNV